MAVRAVSVSQLNGYIKRIMQTDPILADIAVCGEISNLTRHASGHWYFALKDEGSRINCFLPRERVSQLRYEISEGMQVTAYGSVSVYERGGYYSVYVRSLEALGEGDLKIAFENLKKKLEAEGLFRPEHKRPIPAMPKKIGIATSPTGAAVRDIITTLKRRNPFVDILIWPCLVQGEGAAASICEAIDGLCARFPDLDLIIVGRGGGSAEDLWSFNEESVARAVYRASVPVISAVGHEQDVVITDYVADLRAATPTAAGELATADITALKARLISLNPDRLFVLVSSRIDTGLWQARNLKQQADSAVINRLGEAENRLRLLRLSLDAQNPSHMLEKGYALVQSEAGDWKTSAASVSRGEKLRILFSDGSVEAVATAIEETAKP